MRTDTDELADWPPHLPVIGTGESLYSWCATLHRRSCTGSALETSSRLFGSRYAGLLHDFPAHLSEFVLRTQGRVADARTLALQHTLLGYFVPFLQKVRAESLIQGVAAGAVPDLKMRLGIPASGVGGYHPLRCCVECIRWDRENVGWPIWHIEHQMPSVLVCRLHQRPLVQRWHRITPVHRREWLLPTIDPGPELSEIRPADDQALGALLRLAEMSAYATEQLSGALDQSSISRTYRAWAEAQSGMTKDGSLRHETLQRALSSRFDKLRTAFGQLGPVAYLPDLGAILGSLARQRPKPAHPLKHLLLITSMFDDWQGFWTMHQHSERTIPCEDVAPARGSAVTCQPGARHLALDEKQSAFLCLIQRGDGIRAASISAGISVSTGVRWATRHGAMFVRRTRVLVPSVMEPLRQDLARGVDRTSAAQTHKVSLVTINRLLSTDHALRDAWAEARVHAARIKNRASMLRLISEHPGLPISKLRKLPGSGWMWLYRHDKEWLATALPSLWAGSDDPQMEASQFLPAPS